MIGIGDPTVHLLTGFRTSQLVQDFVHQQHPCAKELPPWFLERRNISRRHPGHGLSGKLVCLVLKFRLLNLTNI